jgi:hypothetical protein
MMKNSLLLEVLLANPLKTAKWASHDAQPKHGPPSRGKTAGRQPHTWIYRLNSGVWFLLSCSMAKLGTSHTSSFDNQHLDIMIIFSHGFLLANQGKNKTYRASTAYLALVYRNLWLKFINWFFIVIFGVTVRHISRL